MSDTAVVTVFQPAEMLKAPVRAAARRPPWHVIRRGTFSPQDAWILSPLRSLGLSGGTHRTFSSESFQGGKGPAVMQMVQRS